MELKTKAAIGIGVPLGFLLVIILGTMIWMNFSKKQRLKRGEVTETDSVELEAQRKAALTDPNHQIRWKAY